MKIYQCGLIATFLLCGSKLGLADEVATPEALNKPYVTVNGVSQSMALAEIIFRTQRQRGAPDSDELRKAVRDALVAQAVLEPEAKRAGVDKNLLVQAQLELARREVLIRAWQENFIARYQASETELKTEYAQQIKRLGDKEVLIRHLLVADEESARSLIKQIKAGKSMESLAPDNSRDAATRGRGGLADWTPIGNLLPPLAEATAGLAKGKIVSQPVKGVQGWHVLKLEDIRSFKAPSLEAFKAELTAVLAQRALESNIKGLIDQARIN